MWSFARVSDMVTGRLSRWMREGEASDRSQSPSQRHAPPIPRVGVPVARAGEPSEGCAPHGPLRRTSHLQDTNGNTFAQENRKTCMQAEKDVLAPLSSTAETQEVGLGTAQTFG